MFGQQGNDRGKQNVIGQQGNDRGKQYMITTEVKKRKGKRNI